MHELFHELTVKADKEVDFGVFKLIVRRLSKDLVIIDRYAGEKHLSSINVSLGIEEKVRLLPLPPKGGSLKTKYLYLSLQYKPVYVSPKKTVSILLSIPFDLGVFAEKELVDIIPLCKVKYALYGPSDLGVLCRYIDYRVTGSCRKEFLGNIKIRISNATNAKAIVSKIVVPLESIATFLLDDGSVCFNEIYMTIKNHDVAEIATGLTPSSNEKNIVFSSGYNMRQYIQYIMRYGF